MKTCGHQLLLNRSWDHRGDCLDALATRCRAAINALDLVGGCVLCLPTMVPRAEGDAGISSMKRPAMKAIR